MLFDLRPKSRREELFDREKEIEDSELPLAYARGLSSNIKLRERML